MFANYMRKMYLEFLLHPGKKNPMEQLVSGIHEYICDSSESEDFSANFENFRKSCFYKQNVSF
jgi:hypothetical protein